MSLLAPAIFTVLHLFSGSGGLAKGFHDAGFDSAGNIDLDPRACVDLRNLCGTPAIEADIGAMGPADLRALVPVCPDVAATSVGTTAGVSRSTTQRLKRLNGQPGRFSKHSRTRPCVVKEPSGRGTTTVRSSMMRVSLVTALPRTLSSRSTEKARDRLLHLWLRASLIRPRRPWAAQPTNDPGTRPPSPRVARRLWSIWNGCSPMGIAAVQPGAGTAPYASRWPACRTRSRRAAGPGGTRGVRHGGGGGEPPIARPDRWISRRANAAWSAAPITRRKPLRRGRSPGSPRSRVSGRLAQVAVSRPRRSRRCRRRRGAVCKRALTWLSPSPDESVTLPRPRPLPQTSSGDVCNVRSAHADLPYPRYSQNWRKEQGRVEAVRGILSRRGN